MKEYIIITRCGVTTFEFGHNKFEAAEKCRNEGFKVFIIAEKLTSN